MLNLVNDELIGKRLIVSGLILLSAIIVSLLIKKSTDLVFKEVRRALWDEQIISKTKTARTLLNNITDIVLFAIAILMVLVQWGVDIGPVLAGAGILGLAFSFGAQSLIKDLIAGFFILLEGQFNEGDNVEINDTIKGRVYRMTLRLTILKDKNDNLIYVPNSQITKVLKLKA